MKEYIAFTVLCFIATWSFVRGYRLWKNGRWVSAILSAAISAYTVTFIVAKLGEWL